MSLPPDTHVHSEWSWDASGGSMERSCARAVDAGLPAIAFTEHLDHTVWTVELDDLEPDHPLAALCAPDGRLTPPAMDVAGYLGAVQRCREMFPGLRVMTGLEFGEPHLHDGQVRSVLAQGGSTASWGRCTPCARTAPSASLPTCTWRDHPVRC